MVFSYDNPSRLKQIVNGNIHLDTVVKNYAFNLRSQIIHKSHSLFLDLVFISHLVQRELFYPVAF